METMGYIFMFEKASGAWRQGIGQKQSENVMCGCASTLLQCAAGLLCIAGDSVLFNDFPFHLKGIETNRQRQRYPFLSAGVLLICPQSQGCVRPKPGAQTHSRPSTGVAGPDCLNHDVLPSRVYTGKKLDSEVE